jgi:hypothetical protein
MHGPESVVIRLTLYTAFQRDGDIDGSIQICTLRQLQIKIPSTENTAHQTRRMTEDQRLCLTKASDRCVEDASAEVVGAQLERDSNIRPAIRSYSTL